MQEHVKRMLEEHSQLIIRTDKLDNFLYGNNGFNVHTDINNNKTQDSLSYNMTEYANKCMQLMAMRDYLRALECRLNNEGIFYKNGQYFERIGEITDDAVSEHKIEVTNEQ